MSVLYNEVEPYAARWLRNLSAAGLIAEGSVNETSIEGLEPADLAGARQFHAFAGIGVWSYALRLAGVPDDAPVWTGSCPCQPFSVAGRGRGTSDPRHLWPAWFRLIRECRPPIVFGEQVASPAGREWLDAVSADLEGVGYAVGAADLCAASVGAPHIRQRLYFVAYATARERRDRTPETGGQPEGETGGYGFLGELADSMSTRRPEGWTESGQGSTTGSSSNGGLAYADAHGRKEPESPSVAGGVSGLRQLESSFSAHVMGDPDSARPQGRGLPRAVGGGYGRSGRVIRSSEPTRGFWRPADWLPCQDGKLRPVEPGTFPLAHGAPARVGRLRAYGNAIIPQVAAEFVRAALSAVAASLESP